MNKIIINNGKYLEDIIKKTIEFYKDKNIAIFYKREINNFFINKNIYKSNIKNYYGCDFIGLYKGKYILIEAKECKTNLFKLSRISKSQKNEIDITLKNKGYAFLILYFNEKNKFFIINYEIIMKMNIKQINISEVSKYAEELFLNFPIILDFVGKINIF